MRIRFKKWARPELEASEFYIDTPEEYKGGKLYLRMIIQYILNLDVERVDLSRRLLLKIWIEIILL